MPFHMHRTFPLSEVGWVDESLRVNEDFDCLLLLGKSGFKMAGSPEVSVERWVRPHSLTHIAPQHTFRNLEWFLTKAQEQGFLSDPAIASKRKWGRIRLAPAVMRNCDHSSTEILAHFRESSFPAIGSNADSHEGPRGSTAARSPCQLGGRTTNPPRRAQVVGQA